MVPAYGFLAWVHIEDDDHGAVAKWCRRRSVHATRTRRTEIEFLAVSDGELLPFFIVVAEQILAAARMAEETQNVLVA